MVGSNPLRDGPMIVTCQRGGHRGHARGRSRYPPQLEPDRRLAGEAQLAWPFILDNRFYSALAGADRQQIGMRR